MIDYVIDIRGMLYPDEETPEVSTLCFLISMHFYLYFLCLIQFLTFHLLGDQIQKRCSPLTAASAARCRGTCIKADAEG